ncbi:transporter substrate-binding domain-containing protein [Christensenellaceae bacterium OttesenSCG-928-K19]|nr:transporter substrate-binding domain-containing protein [Christensenellaceae bacterium OttesenSCG-928-K19]
MKKLLCMGILALCTLLCACGGALPDPQEKDVLVAGVRGDAPGFGYIEVGGKEPEGYEVDIAKAIAQKLDKEIEFRIMTDSSREPSLLDGEVDMVVAVYTITKEREERMAFSQPYYTDNLVFMVKEASGILALEGLAGKKVATAVGVTPAEEIDAVLEQGGVQAEVVLYDTFSNAAKAYNEGGIDALFMDESVMHGYLGEGDMLLDSKFSPQELGIAMRKENKQFIQKVEEILAELDETGELAAMRVSWTLEG